MIVNIFHFPDQYSAALVIDVVIAWTLASLVIAAIAKPRFQVASSNPY